MTTAAGAPQQEVSLTPLQQLVLDAMLSKHIPPRLVETVVKGWLSLWKSEMQEIASLARHLRNLLNRNTSIRSIRTQLDTKVGNLRPQSQKLILQVPGLGSVLSSATHLSDQELEQAIRTLADILPH